MAALTHLDEKLAEVLGLAQAAQAATKKVATLARKEKELLELLQRMEDEAAKVEQRCEAATSSRDGVRTAIAKKARETKAEVNGFMKTYLEDAEALDGLEFLSMAEAGELAHWEILANSTKPRTMPRSTRSSNSPSRFSRRTSTPSENSRCGWPAKKTPPSRRKRGDIPVAPLGNRRSPGLPHLATSLARRETGERPRWLIDRLTCTSTITSPERRSAPTWLANSKPGPRERISNPR
jgi:hypothetical protein